MPGIPENVRAWLYRVALAAIVLAAAYGLLADDKAVAAWTALVTAVLGNGLATIYTTTKGDQ